MRVVDLIKSTDNTAFSFEILPPLKGTGIEKLYKTVDTLREFDPKYINITTHRSEYVYKELGNGLYQRTRQRRRPGTVAVAAALQNKYNITVQRFFPRRYRICIVRSTIPGHHRLVGTAW